MKIGELAKITECPVQTIRHYEQERLLSAKQRSEGNFRLYDCDAVDRLLFIKQCRSLDISIPEIRQLLDLSRSPDNGCDYINVMIDQHIHQVDQRINELQCLRRQLQSLRANCSEERTVQECGILKNLSSQAMAVPANTTD